MFALYDGKRHLFPSIRYQMRPAIALFFLSPLIAEFLLGNVAIDGIIAIFFLAPMYGGGALLIRELARRSGGGWPTIFVLGLAYSTWEEALVTQLLFNPTYHGLSLAGAIIPGLGVSATQIINIVTLHTVWSVAVSICLVELFVPKRRTEPWLGPVGLVIHFFIISSWIRLHLLLRVRGKRLLREWTSACWRSCCCDIR